jgi:PleD family two-component response regulator
MNHPYRKQYVPIPIPIPIIEEASIEKSVDSPSISKRKLRCLVANDDSCQLYMMEIILKLNNFEVVTAQNGYEAFEIAAAAMKN